ncbi:MAG: terminase gpA endonuclease subunit [Pseudomonadota bacterium]
MLEIPDQAIGAPVAFKPLRPHPHPRELLANALPILGARKNLSVTEAAEAYVRVPVAGRWQNFDRELTPYMVEPADVTTSRLYRVTALIGPSQSGKTMVLQTTAVHRITCDPMPVLIVHMTAQDRNKWVEQKLDPMIQQSPILRDTLGKGRDDSTLSRKRFPGALLTLGYPTPTMLSSATYGLVALTDFDHMKQVLGPADAPEGTPVGMSRQRVRTYQSRGAVLVESSPAFPWADPSWHPTPEAPHMMPPTTAGIVLIYNEGTRARLYWECMDCGGLYEPRIDRLHYDDSLPPGEAGAAAEMQCPHCGSLTAHRHKVELNRRILKGHGGWLHEGKDGALCQLGDKAMRETDVVSYALNGAAAAFSTWAEIVANLEKAKAKARQLDDETDLAQIHYTEIGVPFKRGMLKENDQLGPQFLRDHAQDTPRGVAPSWVRFVTITADVQKTRFPVQVMGWGLDGSSQILDRFDLITPPAGAPNVIEGQDTRALDPGRYSDDWDVLTDLETRTYEVESTGFRLRAMALVVDFQGEPGVSDNAELFWRARRKTALGRRWFLYRGHGGFKHGRRVWYEAPERGSKGKKARSIMLLNVATDRVKDTVSASLSKADGAPGAMMIGQWQVEAQDAQVEEFTAEERTDKGWVKRPGQSRNESFDLSVMGRAVVEHRGLMRIDAAHPPVWAQLGAANPHCEVIPQGEDPKAHAPEPVPEQTQSAPAGRDDFIPDVGEDFL